MAARAGVVTNVVSKNKFSKFEPGLCPQPVQLNCTAPLSDANFVTLVHDDGTMAQYAHLMHDGVAVEKGQFVNAGEVIGRSGNTGFSSGPHLHFEVYVPALNGSTTHPVFFRQPELARKIPFDDTALPDGYTSYPDFAGNTLYFPNGFAHSHMQAQRPTHEWFASNKDIVASPIDCKQNADDASVGAVASPVQHMQQPDTADASAAARRSVKFISFERTEVKQSTCAIDTTQIVDLARFDTFNENSTTRKR